VKGAPGESVPKRGDLRMRLSLTGLSAALLVVIITSVAFAEEGLIAGVDPSQRPVAAPAITTVDHPGAWYTTSLLGVSQPYPNSLRFLEDQGNWYTPFNHPGMPGRYDIRGWQQK